MKTVSFSQDTSCVDASSGTVSQTCETGVNGDDVRVPALVLTGESTSPEGEFLTVETTASFTSFTSEYSRRVSESDVTNNANRNLANGGIANMVESGESSRETNISNLFRTTLNWVAQFFEENSTYRRQTLWPIIFLSFLYVGACLVASVTVLALTWNKPCDEPLKYWVLVNCIVSLGYTLFKRLSSEDLVDDYSQLTSSQQKWLLCFRVVSWLSLAWFIVGMVWVFRSKSCSSTAPSLYRLALALVAINLVFLGISIILACCIFVLAPSIFHPGFNLDGSVSFHHRGATKKEIERIRLVRYHHVESETDVTCPICLCDYEEGNLLRVLPCTSKHRFHSGCVDRWLVLNKTCPLCKIDIDSCGRNRMTRSGEGDV
eukprot:jgi/Galph1/5571/GphlegSOOS_G4294.1